MKVAILGATGATGSSIINALLESGNFTITALVRPQSVDRPSTKKLEAKGVNIVSFDVNDPAEESAEKLKGQDIAIAAISIAATRDQIPFATAAKLAAVKRFIPTSFGLVVPPKGMVDLRDHKEDVLNHIKKLYLPYTSIDIGWWFQFTLPRLPSGRLDTTYSGVGGPIPGDGNTPSAFTDNRDFGNYVARIIADPRTLNQSVFVYSEMITLNKLYDLFEKLSGETIPREYISEEELKAKLAKLGTDVLHPTDERFFDKIVTQFWYSWGVRGDNTVDYAQYLGYLLGNELYPDVKLTSFSDYIQQLLSSS
ncbi:hypothetical protein BFJ72_g15148 [Fusarium proliferatum]|uniref:NmrA-like domain-containing protein n=1 Tax=Gibberella intermedia TaxID=948311 RepID=A0A420RRB0_GIBIN|nr:hypothetical protein BFJ72_g15148 [Fusarium proliferatum]